MKKIKFSNYSELEKVMKSIENEFIISFNEDCPSYHKVRILDFFSGLVFLNGSMKKLSSNEFEIKIVKENN